MYMMENSAKRETNLARLTEFLEDIRMYCITEDTATIYGQLKAALMRQFGPKEKSKRRTTQITDLGFDENDLWIAAVALQHSLTVISTDSDFQRIRQLTLPHLQGVGVSILLAVLPVQCRLHHGW